jgi:hypothetical protein
MSNEHEVAGNKWKRKKNGLLQMQIEWHNWLSDYVDEGTVQFYTEQNINAGDIDFYTKWNP